MPEITNQKNPKIVSDVIKPAPDNARKKEPTAKFLGVFSTRDKERLFKRVGVVLGILLLVLFVWKYIDAQNQISKLTNSPDVVQNSQKQIIQKVSELVVVPDGEVPQVYTLSDASKFKDNEFFVRAENGDQLLIYQNSGIAVLYRPSTGKIVRAQTVNLKGISDNPRLTNGQ